MKYLWRITILTKIDLKNIAFLFLALTLAACTQPARSEGFPNTPAQSAPAVNAVVAQTAVVAPAGAENKIEAKCIRNSEETQLLINPVQGYCLQYPVGYDIAFLNHMEFMLVKRSLLNAEDPNVFIKVEPANGMANEQVADKLTADYSVPGLEVKRTDLELDQEHAIVLDGLTGQDPNRHVVAVHNDYLYHLNFILMENKPEVRAQAEALFSTVIQSFSFHPETNLCEDCPSLSETPSD